MSWPALILRASKYDGAVMRGTSDGPTPAGPWNPWLAQVKAMPVIVVAATAWIRRPVAITPGFRIITIEDTTCWARTWWGDYRRIGGTSTGGINKHASALPRNVRRKHNALGSSHGPVSRPVVMPPRAIKRRGCGECG